MYELEIIMKKEKRHGLLLTRGMLYVRGAGVNYASGIPRGESFEVQELRLGKNAQWHKVKLSIHYSSVARELVEYAYSHKEMLEAMNKRESYASRRC